ncbi:MAG: hypothetical protein EA358_06735 [Flavobacteriales bacterium]|nr:MAG: hypothetical protein EA358_06735 [Flavobacteriales bacterium]
MCLPKVLVLLIFCHSAFAQWTQLPNAPGIARDDGVAIAFGNDIYTGFGRDQGFYVRNDWWRYSFSDNQWYDLGNTPFERRQYTMIANDETGIVVLGGLLSGVHFRDVWKYSPDLNQWNRLADIPQPVAQGVALSTASGIVCGLGRNENGLSDKLYIYNNERWEYLTSYPGGPRDGVSGISMGNFLLIGWGRGEDQQTYNDWWLYNMTLNTWDSVASPTAPARYWASSVTCDAGGGVVGFGVDSSGNFLNDVWAYSWPENTWKELASLDSLRGGSLVCHDADIHFLWGVDAAFTRRNEHWSLENIIAFDSPMFVYPNPGNGLFHIARRSQQLERYRIVNAIGVIMDEFTCSSPRNCSFELNIPGLYFVFNLSSSKVFKLIVN